jgi:hypothetical protein
MDNRTLPDREQTEKLLQALTAGHEALFQIILEPRLEIVTAALKNPHMGEDHLLALLKRQDLSEELIDKIYQRQQKSLSHKLSLALAKNRATPDLIVRTLLPRLYLFELVDICFLPGVSADKRINAERNILQRLPTTPLGNKLTLARRGTASIVAELLKEGHPTLTEACLSSPYLKEAALYQFLTGPRATAETISLIARHNRWQHRPNLRQAILRNAKTPDIWFTLWLPKLSLPLLKQLLAGQKLKPKQKQLVSRELQRRAGK